MGSNGVDLSSSQIEAVVANANSGIDEFCNNVRSQLSALKRQAINATMSTTATIIVDEDMQIDYGSAILKRFGWRLNSHQEVIYVTVNRLPQNDEEAQLALTQVDMHEWTQDLDHPVSHYSFFGKQILFITQAAYAKKFAVR